MDSYEDNFTDEVWDGRSRTLWPMVEEGSARNEFWKRRMAVLRSKFEREVQNLKTLIKEYDERRHEIRSLREQVITLITRLSNMTLVERRFANANISCTAVQRYFCSGEPEVGGDDADYCSAGP